MNYMTNSKQKFVAFRRKLDLWERRENELFPQGSLGCSDTSGRHCIYTDACVTVFSYT